MPVKIDILVNLLVALQPFADGATTLPLNDTDQPLDYSRLIGNLVISHDGTLAQLTSSLNSLYSSVFVLQTQMTTIIANGLTVPYMSLYGIMVDSALYPIEIISSAIGTQLIALRDATGDPSDLNDAVDYQDKVYEDLSTTLSVQSSLYTAGFTMSDLTGWVSSPTTTADTIKNMWVTINDMRKAVQGIITPGAAITCDDINVAYSGTIDSPNSNIRLRFLGLTTIPDGFVDTDSNGALLSINDGANFPYYTYVNIKNASTNITGVIINLNETGINPFLPLTLSLQYSFINNGVVCTGTEPLTITPSSNVCGNLSALSLGATTAQAIYNPLVTNNVVYSFKIARSSAPNDIIEESTDFTNPSSQFSFIFGAEAVLDSGTEYLITLHYTIGSGDASFCPGVLVTTGG